MFAKENGKKKLNDNTDKMRSYYLYRETKYTTRNKQKI